MKYRSMIYKVSIAVIIGVSFVLSAFGIYQYKQTANELMDELNTSLIMSTKRIANSLSLPVYACDYLTIHRIIMSEMENHLINGIFILESDDENIQSGYIRDENGNIFYLDTLLPEANSVSVKKEMVYDAMSYGKIKVYMTQEYLKGTLKNVMISTIIQIIISDAVLAIILITMINIIVIKPITHLNNVTTEMASGNLEQVIEINSKDEIGVLANSFLMMRDAVVEKIINLENQKKELKIAETELEKHKLHLEDLVDERTNELKEANRSLARLKTAIEQSIDGIAVIDNDDNIIFVNEAWAHMHGWQVEELQNQTYEIFHTPEQLSDEVNAFKEVVNRTGKNETQVPHVKKDGTEFPTWMSISELREDTENEEKGEVIGIVCIAKDITEKIKAEKALATAQRELINKAHQAGMADIASGTLHNVGNILNSVKTSSQVIAHILEGSCLEKLERANELLRSNIETIEDFVIHNPKGRKLLKYYLVIENHFRKENEKINHHLVRLEDKIGAISEVIIAQQNYAGTCSLLEKYDLAEIVEDALIMQLSLIEQYNIIVEKDFQNIPPIKVQKNKLIHILINLLQNAQDAMRETDPSKRKLTCMIYGENKDIIIKISDTGCGIKKENLEKIFSHGFTTKMTGHGFGMHSSANYMSEMGGEMWAESDGEGQGATIYLAFKNAVTEAVPLHT